MTDYDRIVNDMEVAIGRNSALCDERDQAIRERDAARAEVERWKDAADDLAGPIDRIFELRALLREVAQGELLSPSMGAFVDIQLPMQVWIAVRKTALDGR